MAEPRDHGGAEFATLFGSSLNFVFSCVTVLRRVFLTLHFHVSDDVHRTQSNGDRFPGHN